MLPKVPDQTLLTSGYYLGALGWRSGQVLSTGEALGCMSLGSSRHIPEALTFSSQGKAGVGEGL